MLLFENTHQDAQQLLAHAQFTTRHFAFESAHKHTKNKQQECKTEAMVTLSSTTSSSEPSKAKATYRRLPLDDPAAKRLTTSFVEVSSVALGARVVKASDEFFAEKENLIKVEVSHPDFPFD